MPNILSILNSNALFMNKMTVGTKNTTLKNPDFNLKESKSSNVNCCQTGKNQMEQKWAKWSFKSEIDLIIIIKE